MYRGDVSIPDGLSLEILTVIARFNRWVSGHTDLPLPVGQARLLALVSEMHDARVSELARADYCTQPTMTVQLRRMQEAGYVERRPDPQDGRAQRIRLTSKGRQMLDAMRAARSAVFEPWLVSLPDGDRQVLADATRVLAELTSRMRDSDRGDALAEEVVVPVAVGTGEPGPEGTGAERP